MTRPRPLTLRFGIVLTLCWRCFLAANLVLAEEPLAQHSVRRPIAASLTVPKSTGRDPSHLVAWVQRKQAPPADAQLVVAKKLLSEIFREDFERALKQNNSERWRQLRSLSAKIAGTLDSETEPVKRFAIFQVAVEIGKQSGEMKHTLDLLQRFEDEFDIDAVAIRYQSFEYWMTQLPSRNKSASETKNTWLQINDEIDKSTQSHVNKRQFEAALRFAKLQNQCLQKAGDSRKAEEMAAMLARIGRLSELQARTTRLMEALSSSKSPAADKLAIGLYFCVELDDWNQGLPYLKDASDKQLAMAASQELANDSSSEAIGDAWWELSQNPEYEKWQTRFRLHAAEHYALALRPAQGLTRVKLEKRIKESGWVPRSDAGQETVAKEVAKNQQIDLALGWLIRQQRPDGSWSLTGPFSDGAVAEDVIAATSMALLAFVGQGHTHKQGEYKAEMRRALAYLLRQQSSEGLFAVNSKNKAYSQALATLVVLRVYKQTGDGTYKIPSSKAVSYAQWSQGRQGGWRYEPREDSDLSVTGWYLTVLHEAAAAGFKVEADVLKKAEGFLDSVAGKDDSHYSYREREKASLTMTAVGLLTRIHLGWSRDHQAIQAAVDRDLLRARSDTAKSVYFSYYGTKLLWNVGGDAWKTWQDSLRSRLNSEQEKSGALAGSWSPEADSFATAGGRLYTTCFSIYALQLCDLPQK